MDNSYIDWAINCLSNKGYLIHNAIPETVQNTPWSEVYRFKTDKGYIFLKKVPPALSLEPKIINILRKEFHAPVPLILADNQDLHCFLMQDAGIPLHDYFKKDFQADILIQAMQDYSTLQLMTSEKSKLFFDLGVPDWSLDKLPTLYRDVICKESFLIDDGLNHDELIKLNKMESKLISICEKLSCYEIKETFGHADFHAKNILIDISSSQTTLIDLGEVVITHPFFSFLNCLHRAKENYLISDTHYQQIQLACLKPWLALETEKHLFEILDLIHQCWSIHAMLGEFRLIHSVDKSAFEKLHRQGRIARNLRHWINQQVT